MLSIAVYAGGTCVAAGDLRFHRVENTRGRRNSREPVVHSLGLLPRSGTRGSGKTCREDSDEHDPPQGSHYAVLSGVTSFRPCHVFHIGSAHVVCDPNAYSSSAASISGDFFRRTEIRGSAICRHRRLPDHAPDNSAVVSTRCLRSCCPSTSNLPCRYS